LLKDFGKNVCLSLKNNLLEDGGGVGGGVAPGVLAPSPLRAEAPGELQAALGASSTHTSRFPPPNGNQVPHLPIS